MNTQILSKAVSLPVLTGFSIGVLAGLAHAQAIYSSSIFLGGT